MTFVAVVCGAGDRWGAPGVFDDPYAMLALLTGTVSAEGPTATVSRATDLGETASQATAATHLLLLTRPSAGPAMRHLATLLRARDPQRHVAVLETPTTPLGMTLVAEHVNALGLEPGAGVARVEQLLARTPTGWWVRRAGRLSEGRPSLWQVVRSWFSRTGYLAIGSDPLRIVLADAAAWEAAIDGGLRLVTCGDIPEVPRQNLGERGPDDIYARDLSWGGRAVVRQRAAFEWAAPSWTPDTQPDSTPGGQACDSCGATTVAHCPFCHALWGRHHGSTDPGRHPVLVAQGEQS